MANHVSSGSPSATLSNRSCISGKSSTTRWTSAIAASTSRSTAAATSGPQRSISIWVQASITLVGPGSGRADAGEHAVGVALDGQCRVDEQMDAEVVPVEDETHRVDEERHVLGDEHQDRTGRPPSVALEVGRQDLREDLARLSPSSESEVGIAGRIQVVASTAVGVVVGQLGVVLGQQRAEQRIVRASLVRQRLEVAQNVGHVIVSHLPRTIVYATPTHVCVALSVSCGAQIATQTTVGTVPRRGRMTAAGGRPGAAGWRVVGVAGGWVGGACGSGSIG